MQLSMISLYLPPSPIGQDPIVPADTRRRQIPFQDSPIFPRLPSGSQAIITTYRFRTCARIKEWRTFIRPSGRYTIRFQVWRQESDTIYNLVGENEYLDFDVQSSPVIATISDMYIMVQPGDVLGYFVSTNDGESENDERNEGILLDPSFRDELIYYCTFGESEDVNRPTPSQVTVGSGGILDLSVRVGPIISPVVGECYM